MKRCLNMETKVTINSHLKQIIHLFYLSFKINPLPLQV
ncbi:hypothetical protein HMPREF1146_0929 [Prevotella sp. MSX73]|nr:hypothetical protein HMPREF1146_0929 [Prevotella sp. MSX73]